MNQGLLAQRLGQPPVDQECLAGSSSGPGSRVTAPSRNELAPMYASMSMDASPRRPELELTRRAATVYIILRGSVLATGIDNKRCAG